MEHAVQNILSIAPAFLTTKEAAHFLGLSNGMIRKMVHAKRVPVRHFGRAIRIPSSWLNAQAAEIVAPAVQS